MRRVAFVGAGALLLLTGFVASNLLGRVGTSDASKAGVVADQAQETEYESDPEVIQRVLTGGVPMGRWKEGLLFEGIEPQPWLKSAANWFPGTEDVQPDEMRITFMGTAPMLRPGQMNTSIYVELGNGDSFIFDFGEGAVANYLASGIPINKLNDIFLSHLHVDHFGSLPWV